MPPSVSSAQWLELLADRERLESDMQSMSQQAMQQMEMLHQINAVQERIALGCDDVAAAEVVVEACTRAALARRVVYLSLLPNGNLGEVKAVACHPSLSDDERNDPTMQLDSVLAADLGLVGEALQTGRVLQRQVPSGTRLLEPGRPEFLAERLLLVVPVTYGPEGKRVQIGALLLCDRMDDDGAGQDEFLQGEVDMALLLALMLGSVVGARKTVELGKEMTTARAIQQQILPSAPAQVPGYAIAAQYQACGAVGGDYFDYVRMADGRTMVVVADVSGHNLASGMMMVSARATLRTLAAATQDPAQAFNALASTMYDDLTHTERFLTAAALVLQPEVDEVEYINAGHNDLLVYRAATDCVSRVPADGTILGFVKHPEYRSSRLQLQPGDCALLCTDGITEACDACGEMFGEDRLCCLLAQLAPLGDAQQITAGILAAVAEFQGTQPRNDDITAVVVSRLNQGGKP